MSAFKQFTVQDYSVVPFNAHKQYNFNSESAALNQLTYFQTQWTSESISLYSSESSVYGGDIKNVIKYNQIDHLFYRNFKSNQLATLDSFNFAKQKRELYKSATILSIPSGLYGLEIKKGSFYLSSSGHEIVDDTHGNLIVSGTDVNNYPTNINANIFRLDPLDGYKKIDLSIYEDYAVKYNTSEGIAKRHFLKGTKNPNASTTYTTYDNFDKDDSYYHQNIKYCNVQFQTSSLDPLNSDFSFVSLNSSTGSYIVSPHKSMYNFNRDDDFSISFYMKPKEININTVNIGDKLGGGIVFHKNVENNEVLVVYPKAHHTSTVYSTVAEYPTDVAEVIDLVSDTQGMGSGSSNTTALANSSNGADFPLAKEISELKKGGYSDWWLPNFLEMDEIRKTLGGNSPTDFQGVQTTAFAESKRSLYHSTYIDLGIPQSTYADGNAVSINGPIAGGSGRHYKNPATFFGVEVIQSDYLSWALSDGMSLAGTNRHGRHIIRPYSWESPTFPGYDLNPEASINVFGEVGGTTPAGIEYYSSTTINNNDNDTLFGEPNHFGAPFYGGSTMSPDNITESPNEDFSNIFGDVKNFVLLVRKVDLSKFPYDNTEVKNYIIAKSGTKTVLPSSQVTSTGAPANTNEGNNMQFIDTDAGSSFPYEIYLKSSSLYFDRSDGDKVASISYEITGSNVGIFKYSHIVCQNSASKMQIWFDGSKSAELDTSTFLENKKTSNKANLYIGSRGHRTSDDAIDEKSKISYFNGEIGYINIYNHHLESSSIVPMSESINNSPYIGNLFYQNGFGVITHPKYTKDILGLGLGGMTVGQNFSIGTNDSPGIAKVRFQGTHQMYENEFQCTVRENEFNHTYNTSARKNKDAEQSEFEDFTTSSIFKPYVTTIGLYNEQRELLVVGKLTQPIRVSDETDTTFIIRYDT